MNEPKKLTLPTCHTNGTSARDLTEQCSNAYRAINEAIEAVCLACPNGRDYYPQGPEAYRAARSQHDARLTVLNAIADEYMEIAQHTQQFEK